MKVCMKLSLKVQSNEKSYSSALLLRGLKVLYEDTYTKHIHPNNSKYILKYVIYQLN